MRAPQNLTHWEGGGKDVTAADVERARQLGTTDREIHDAVLIAAARYRMPNHDETTVVPHGRLYGRCWYCRRWTAWSYGAGPGCHRYASATGRRSHPAVRAVALSLHAVHGAVGRDRWLGRGRLGPPQRSMARRPPGDYARARADDDAMGRHLCGLLPLAGRRRASRRASSDAQPAVGWHRIEPGGYR